jgi:RNA polymerase-associated protein
MRMVVATSKRSVMTLYSGANDMFSHQVRLVLAEKGVAADIVEVDPSSFPEELAELNPYNTVPTLVDRELVLYEASIIMEYVDERFPHPPLMPVYPVARAQSRLMMTRVVKDWYFLANQIMQNKNVDANRQSLEESLISIASVFSSQTFFMSDEFTLLDCTICALLWRLPELGIKFAPNVGKPIETYMKTIFHRQGFKNSLTHAEREINVGYIL